jgi:hypothetical protein
MISAMSWTDAAIGVVLKYQKLTPDLFSKLPHLLEFSAKLKISISASDFHGGSHRIQAGEEVYVSKGNNGWLIGKYINNNRYEIVTDNYAALFDYVESLQSGDLLHDIEIKLEEYNKRNSKYNTPKYLISKLNEQIQDKLENIFKSIASSFKIYPAEEEINVVKSWSKYILPKYLKMLKSRKLTDLYKSKPDALYNWIWCSNELKPDDTSFVKFFTTIMNRETHKNTFKQPSLAGKENAENRTEMAKLTNWVNSYGLSNKDELWATAIEYFFKLSPEYRKVIIKLMLYS